MTRFPFPRFALPTLALCTACLCGSAYGQLTNVWSRNFPQQALGVSASTDAVYVAGAGLLKFDLSGNQLWTRSLTFTAQGVSAGTDGVYVVGDGIVVRYDSQGNELWSVQSNSVSFGGVSAAVDGVYVVGSTPGILPGPNQSGNGSAFVSKYDQNGNKIWTRQFGDPPSSCATPSNPQCVIISGSATAVRATAGGIYVVAQQNSPSDVYKYDSDGNL